MDAASPEAPVLTVALDMPSAHVLADQASIIQDLQFVMDCCKRLLTELARPEEDRDAVVALAEEQVLAYRYFGTRFDCGSKIGYLKATVQLALQHPEVREDFEAYLRECLPALFPAAAVAEQPELIEPF